MILMSDYSLSELAERAGVTPRTIRYYIQSGLLPSPGTSGPGKHYDDRYLRRIHLIKRLQHTHLPLAEIRQRLDALDEEEIRELAHDADEAGAEPDSASDYIAGLLVRQRTGDLDDEPVRRLLEESRRRDPPPGKPLRRSRWERISLGPDIEIHVQRPLSRRKNRLLDEIVDFARELLEKEGP